MSSVGECRDPSRAGVGSIQSPLSDLRLLVVRQPDKSGRRSQFVDELARRTQLVDVVYPQPAWVERTLINARAFHPRRRRWRARAGFNERLAMRRTEAVQRGLTSHRGDHDLIMQIQTLCAPGTDRSDVPYMIYTDNTMALTQRHYRMWAPISSKVADWWLRYEASIFRGAAAVFTYSEFARRSAIEDYGCSPDRVVAAGAGANQVLSGLQDKDYTVPRALFVGFEFERKGGSRLLQAWPLVRKRVPGAELVIAGPRRRPMGTLPAGVTWMGRCDRSTLGELYRSASLFVMPSLFEPWGHVFVEAMGHGLACVGTTGCAMPEIIEDGVTGRLVGADEAEPLADAVVELLSDPAKMAAMGGAAYERVQRERSWSHVVDRVLKHLAKTRSPTTGVRHARAGARSGLASRAARSAGASRAPARPYA
jgi:starch synthase